MKKQCWLQEHDINHLLEMKGLKACTVNFTFHQSLVSQQAIQSNGYKAGLGTQMSGVQTPTTLETFEYCRCSNNFSTVIPQLYQFTTSHTRSISLLHKFIRQQITVHLWCSTYLHNNHFRSLTSTIRFTQNMFKQSAIMSYIQKQILNTKQAVSYLPDQMRSPVYAVC